MGLSNVAAETEGSFFSPADIEKETNLTLPSNIFRCRNIVVVFLSRWPDVRQRDRAAGITFLIWIPFGLSTMVWRFWFADSDKGGRDLYAVHQLLPMLLILQLKTVWLFQDAAFFFH